VQTAAPVAQGPDEGSLPVAGVLGGFLLALLLGTPRMIRAVDRRRRWTRAGDPATAATAAWEQLRADTLDHGLGWHPAESPRGVLRRLGPALGTQVAEPLARITLAQELACYAPPGHPQRATPQGLRADAELVRGALASSSPRWTRVRAEVFPPSSLDLVRRSFARLRGMTGRRAGPQDGSGPEANAR
jgi:hypothetical protein